MKQWMIDLEEAMMNATHPPRTDCKCFDCEDYRLAEAEAFFAQHPESFDDSEWLDGDLPYEMRKGK